MNENEIARIAAMANSLRPDWPVASLRTLLARPELANRSRRDVAVAMAWIACESNTEKPARVIESGPWWIAANVETPDRIQRRPPRIDEECRQHPGEYAPPICRCCHADKKAERDQADAVRAEAARLTREEAIAAARQAIADRPRAWPSKATTNEESG